MQCQICEVCLNSAVLCPTCQRKVDNRELEENDVEILRYIHSLAGDVKSLKDVNVVKIIGSSSLTIIAAVGDASRLVGKGGAVVKMISKKFKKNVRILEADTNIKAFIQNLVSPGTVAGINKLYSLSGEVYKVRVPNTTFIKPEEFSNIISSVYGLKAELVLE